MKFTNALDNELKSKIIALPKIELHRHLEGTMHFPTLHKIALKNGMDVPNQFDDFEKEFQFPKDSQPDFLLFLSKFHNNWYKSLENIEQIVNESILDLKKENLHYLELRFSPEHYSSYQDFNRKDVTSIIIETATNAAKQIDLEINFILTFNRSKQSEAEMAKLYSNITPILTDSVVAIDLAGDEIHYPARQFKSFFKEIRNEGLRGIDIHAGEACPSSSIWEAIDLLKADRIGHGISCYNDDDLIKELLNRDIQLCQCITSNFQTNSWSTPENHPIDRLVKSNLNINISSDDPTIQGSTLIDDYFHIASNFNWTIDDFKKSNLKSIDGIFLNKNEKKRIKENYINKLN